MGIVSTFIFTSDTETVTRVKLNSIVANLLTEFNGNIDNDNVKAAAGIVYSKLNLTDSIVDADINSSAAIADTKLDTIDTAGKVDGAALTGLANIPSGAGDIPVANLSAALELVYPVGCVYTEITGVNPNTTFGFGTWVAFGAGRVPVGYDSGDTDFDTAEETGGAKTHTLTEAEMPSHTHSTSQQSSTNDNSGGNGNIIREITTTNSSITGTTQSAGSGDAHTNVQPYIVVHMWKRTA